MKITITYAVVYGEKGFTKTASAECSNVESVADLKEQLWNAVVFATPRMKCRVCSGEITRGVALVPSLVGHPDFPGDTGTEPGCTITEGPGVVRQVWKCKDCGHSFFQGTIPIVAAP